MEDERSGAPRIVGTVSKIAGASVGTAVSAGRKALRFVRGEPLEEPVEVEDPRVPSSAPALNTGQQKKLKGQIVALESELAEARDEARKERAELASRLEAVGADKQVLLSRLEEAHRELEGSKGREGALRARVDALESDLAEARDEVQGKQSELASRLEAFEADRGSLLSDLEQARREAEDSRDREAALRARLAALASGQSDRAAGSAGQKRRRRSPQPGSRRPGPGWQGLLL
jgi:DNA repair exonuclease SbcCD ATPase subunit